MAGILNKIGTTLEMIKWEHSIFALPLCIDCDAAGSGRVAGLANRSVDRRGHGFSSVGGNGL